jgi:sec-independent protein translocase protein TatB
MLPEIGATELIVIAAVALIVVGPKDLPLLMRKVGRFMARMRGMAAEFRSSFDEMARQSELDELRQEVEALRQGKFIQPVVSDIDESFRGIDADLRPNSVMTGPYEPEPEPYAQPLVAEPELETAEAAREARA